MWYTLDDEHYDVVFQRGSSLSITKEVWGVKAGTNEKVLLGYIFRMSSDSRVTWTAMPINDTSKSVSGFATRRHAGQYILHAMGLIDWERKFVI